MNYKTKVALRKAFKEVFTNIPIFILWVAALIFFPVDFYAVWNNVVEPTISKNLDLVLDAVMWMFCLYAGYGFYKRYKVYKKAWD